MNQKTASIVSIVLSLLMLIIFAVLAVIFELIALNGASERQATSAIGISLACIGSGAILLGILAGKATSLMITNLDLNPVLAVTLTVMLAVFASGVIAMGAAVLSIPLAGMR